MVFGVMVYGIGPTTFTEYPELFASPPVWSLQDAQFAEFFQETQKYRAAGPIRMLRSGHHFFFKDP